MNKVIIRNFQAHEDLTIELGPTITSIVGATDAGKSSILRAIWWAMTNQPKGEAFIRDGETTAEVELEVDERTIHRSRSHSQNVYLLDGREFKAFGNDVPSDIRALLNISPLNYQGQHDAPFWFADTAGGVSRQLNQIVDLGAIDSALANIDSAVRKGRVAIEVSQERRAALKVEGRALKWTKQAHLALGAVEALNKEWVSKAADRVRLGLLINQVEKYETKARTLLGACKSAQGALGAGRVWETLHGRLGALERSTSALKTIMGVISRPLPPPLAPLEALGARMQGATTQKQALTAHIARLEEGEKLICQRSNELSNAQSDLKRAMGDRCPLCGNKIRS